MSRAICWGWVVVLLGGGWGAASIAVSGEIESSGDARLTPVSADSWTMSHARHLLFQAGFGGTPEEVRKLFELGPQEAVNRLVDFDGQATYELESPSAAELPELVRPKANATPEERRQLATQIRRDDQQRMAELRSWWVRRMIESPRPLEEKLTLFWHGLLTSGHQTVRSSFAMYQQNELLRRHAAGNYGTLLHAIVHDPAMLRYLDNNSNVRGRPNENLARELLELFSLGEGNYTEADIKEAARALTGYAVDRQNWQFRLISRSHDEGEKTIFGQTGNWDGDKLVDLILQQPAAARYIVRKLFIFFVHDSPDEALIDALASSFREHDYELKPVLKTIFLSQEFYGDRALGTHIKSPAELVIGTVRALSIERVDHPGLVQALRGMGQNLFDPPNVKGWDGGRTWLSTNWLLTRQNFAVTLVAGGAGMGRSPAKLPRNRPGARNAALDLTALVKRENLKTADEIVSYFSDMLLPGPLAEGERAELHTAVGDVPPADAWPTLGKEMNAKLHRLVALLVSMPQYQLS